MKGITRITRRLMLMFLALIASSMMFLSPPAVAATSSLATLNSSNFETEVVKSDKPVVVILALEDTLGAYQLSLEKLKSEAEKFYGDKYKIVVGKGEENREIFNPLLRIYPPFPTGSIFKNGEQVVSSFDIFAKKLNDGFAYLKDCFENS